MSAAATTLLGGLAPAAFLRRHWQRAPRLVRGARPGFAGLHTFAQLATLAGRDDVESRVIVRERGRYHLDHGPFRKADLRALPPRAWTLLVQGMNLLDDASDALMREFAFIPYARLDDVMVSYAAEGGGVGPHTDAYDVFLLQGFGRRRWRYGRQADLTLVPDLPVKILRTFEPTDDAVLEGGDMLYLPPEVAHDGVAVGGPCTTYSIGFRAATYNEMAEHFLDALRDAVDIPGRYGDAGLAPTRTPARIDPRMTRRIAAALAQLKWRPRDVARFAGAFLSEPKAHVTFERPARALTARAFGAAIDVRGVALDRRALLLYDAAAYYLNGEAAPWPAQGATTLRALANDRSLPARACRAAPPALRALLHEWHCHGYVVVEPTHPRTRA